MQNNPEHFIGGRDFARIARAIAYIDAQAVRQPSLQAVADHVGLSEFHFNRLFHRWAGLTPKQYLQRVTGVAAEAALAEEPSLMDAAHAVGLSGAGRLHDLMVQLHAQTPAQVRAGGAGVEGWYGISDTPFGSALFAGTSRGLCHLAFIDAGESTGTDIASCDADCGMAGVETERARLAARWPAARFERDDARAAALARQAWAADTRPAELLLRAQGTPFQLKVWEALLRLPDGATVTYTDIARDIGRPDGVRAVASAIGANDIAWLIPCHRVLRKGGALGGYRWGLERKRAMLAWEQLHRAGAG